jgi:LAO/AO transport system kinase
VILSKAITLIESKLNEDNRLADEIIEELHVPSRDTYRIGITGVPGVGKSTFIEAVGNHIIEDGHRVAILAIDPSSQKTGGSILGDKTRMESLSNNSSAFIRPSPTGSALGGVANKTRETMILCEAAGFDVILIETVGVGQSEVAVHGMVDFFLLLALAGAGDELQGIKKGIMEMADAIVVNKADGDNLFAAKRAMAELSGALHLFAPPENEWFPKVMTCSSLESTGVDEVWDTLKQYNDHMTKSGYLSSHRSEQNLEWFNSQINFDLQQRLMNHPQIKEELSKLRSQVLNGQLHPKKAAHQITERFYIKE